MGLRGRGCGQRSLSFGGGGSGREELDLLANSTAEVRKALLDVGGIVVRFVRVLRAIGKALTLVMSIRASHEMNLRHRKHLLMDLLEGIDSLL